MQGVGVGAADLANMFQFTHDFNAEYCARRDVAATRELHPRTWMREILLLPCLLALGVGLSLNNARAVLEAVFNHKSDFARTPKYGIERKSQSWRNCKYMPLRSFLPIAEMAFALYFGYFV